MYEKRLLPEEEGKKKESRLGVAPEGRAVFC